MVKDIIKVVCVIIGTVIGAGFASGKEIYVFFNSYGEKGILGIIISNILTGLIIYKVLMHIRNDQINNYKDYIGKFRINKRLREVLCIIINIFLLITFYIMIAGFCAYFKQEFDISSTIIAIIVSYMCYITFMKNIEGVTKVNSILIPFLIIMILLIGKKTNFTRSGLINRHRAFKC